MAEVIPTPWFRVDIDVARMEVRASDSGGATIGGGDRPRKIQLSTLEIEVLKLFEKMLREGRINDYQELILLGRIMYKAIFTDIEEAFIKALGEATGKERLRVELVFQDNANELADLPWEFLYYPGVRNSFLATKTDLVLMRHIPPGYTRERFAPFTEDLKILIVNVQPQEILQEMEEVDDRPYEPIIETMKDLKVNYPIEIVAELTEPTAENLMDVLNEKRPHIVHYIGYGKSTSGPGPRQDCIALLQSDLQRAHWLTSTEFAAYFEDTRPELVFLHLCQVPNKAPRLEYMQANFGQLAPQLLNKRIKAVIAMQYPVNPDIAQKFTERFYRSLARGDSVATAVQEGRRNLYLLGRAYSRLGSPVLYMSSFDGLILSGSRREPRPEKGGDSEKALISELGLSQPGRRI
jgi:hypothetical protein